MCNLYRLGEFEVDVKRRQIRFNGALVPLPQKPLEVLLVLIGRAGDVVTKEELMGAIWPESFVEESNLTQSIFLLRKALGDKASGSRYVITLPGVGYQLGVPPVVLPSPLVEEQPRAKHDLAPVTNGIQPSPGPKPSRRIYVAAVGCLAMVAMILCGWGVLRVLRPAPFSKFSLRRLTNSDDIQLTMISLSGRYVAYVSKNPAGVEALSVLELHSGNSHVILHDDSMRFADIVFSPDDSYIYYRGRRREESDQISSEYRLPLLGGQPTQLVKDIDGPIAFLNHGERICFWRRISENLFAILSADADSGKNETTLAKGERPLPISAVCSPDGYRAAISSEVGGISILDFKTGQRKAFYESPAGSEIFADLYWNADGSTLLASAITPFNFYPSLLTVSYPGGKRTQITRDLNSYQNPSMTGDGAMIAARQGDVNAHFESFELPLLAGNPEVVSFPWSEFLGWRNDQEIAGTTTSGGLKIKNLATSQESLIQTPRGMQFLQPTGCGASALVALGSRPPDKNLTIWHMNADGSNLKQLSPGPEDILPVCTQDGKWVVYADNSGLNRASLYRVSSDGGTPTKVGEGSVWFVLSHDGRRVSWVENTGGKQSLVLIELGTGKRIASVPVPTPLHATRSLTFAPDDQHIFFIARGETSDSIYDLPIDGSAASKRIEFRGAHLSVIMVSPSGKYLGAVTVKPVSDAVLLADRSR